MDLAHIKLFIKKFSFAKFHCLVALEILHTPNISHFFKKRFISRKRVSLLSLCKCSTGILSLAFMNRPSPELSLYPAKQNWLLGKELLILVSDTKNISNVLKMKGFSNLNYFEVNLYLGGLLLHFLDFQIKMT